MADNGTTGAAAIGVVDASSTGVATISVVGLWAMWPVGGGAYIGVTCWRATYGRGCNGDVSLRVAAGSKVVWSASSRDVRQAFSAGDANKLVKWEAMSASRGGAFVPLLLLFKHHG